MLNFSAWRILWQSNKSLEIAFSNGNASTQFNLGVFSYGYNAGKIASLASGQCYYSSTQKLLFSRKQTCWIPRDFFYCGSWQKLPTELVISNKCNLLECCWKGSVPSGELLNKHFIVVQCSVKCRKPLLEQKSSPSPWKDQRVPEGWEGI